MTTDLQTSSIPDLEKLLADLRVRYNSGDKTVETRLRAVAARLEVLKAQNPKPQQNKIQVITKILNPILRKRCCGR